MYAKKDITRKGQLKLAPFTNIAKAKENQSPRVFVEKGATKWFITAPKLSKFESSQAESLVPFWWVKFGDEANTEYSMQQQDGFKIPIVQHCQSIAARSACYLRRDWCFEFEKAEKVRGWSFWTRTKDAKKAVFQQKGIGSAALSLQPPGFEVCLCDLCQPHAFFMLCNFNGFSSRSCEPPLCFGKYNKHQHVML